jgi:hypothetical protein
MDRQEYYSEKEKSTQQADGKLTADSKLTLTKISYCAAGLLGVFMYRRR